MHPAPATVDPPVCTTPIDAQAQIESGEWKAADPSKQDAALAYAKQLEAGGTATAAATRARLGTLGGGGGGGQYVGGWFCGGC